MNRITAFFSSIWPWVEAHPVFASVIFWPIVTAIVTWFLKPRSPEEYAALAASHPRIAQVLRLVGALGLDAPKVLQILGDMVKRIPKAHGVLPVFLLAVALSNAACTPAMRQAITESAADKTQCALRHLNLTNEEIVKQCLQEGAVDDIKRILALVGTAREETARAALNAASRQRDLDQKVGICRPEKTSSP